MSTPHFSNIDACVFDAYGTLFNVHSAIGRHRERLGESADAASALWRTKQIEYIWLRSLMGRHADFWTVTSEALDFVLDAFHLSDQGLHDDLMEAYLRLDAYPEVPAMLDALQARGMPLAILTNGSPGMIDAAVSSSGLQSRFDALLSVEEVGIYKPDSRVYQLAVDRFATRADRILFMSSNGWDAGGAACFGFRVAWINRAGQPPERLPCIPEVVLNSLEPLPSLIA